MKAASKQSVDSYAQQLKIHLEDSLYFLFVLSTLADLLGHFARCVRVRFVVRVDFPPAHAPDAIKFAARRCIGKPFLRLVANNLALFQRGIQLDLDAVPVINCNTAGAEERKSNKKRCACVRCTSRKLGQECSKCSEKQTIREKLTSSRAPFRMAGR